MKENICFPKLFQKCCNSLLLLLQIRAQSRHGFQISANCWALQVSSVSAIPLNVLWICASPMPGIENSHNQTISELRSTRRKEDWNPEADLPFPTSQGKWRIPYATLQSRLRCTVDPAPTSPQAQSQGPWLSWNSRQISLRVLLTSMPYACCSHFRECHLLSQAKLDQFFSEKPSPHFLEPLSTATSTPLFLISPSHLSHL
jgi:hypothetical protein